MLGKECCKFKRFKNHVCLLENTQSLQKNWLTTLWTRKLANVTNIGLASLFSHIDKGQINSLELYIKRSSLKTSSLSVICFLFTYAILKRTMNDSSTFHSAIPIYYDRYNPTSSSLMAWSAYVNHCGLRSTYTFAAFCIEVIVDFNL